MKRLNQEVRFRSREASPVTYQVGLPLLEMVLASLGISVLAGLLATLGGAGLVGAAKTGGVVFVVLAAILLALRFGKEVLQGIKGLTVAQVGAPEPRFIYVKGAGQRKDDDLADFVRGLPTKGTSRRDWVGSRLPTTNHLMTKGMWTRFTSILSKAGLLESISGGGTEFTADVDEALEVLGL